MACCQTYFILSLYFWNCFRNCVVLCWYQGWDIHAKWSSLSSYSSFHHPLPSTVKNYETAVKCWDFSGQQIWLLATEQSFATIVAELKLKVMFMYCMFIWGIILFTVIWNESCTSNEADHSGCLGPLPSADCIDLVCCHVREGVVGVTAQMFNSKRCLLVDTYMP